MKTIILLFLTVLLLSGCATTQRGQIAISPEVRKMSTADDRLFIDLLTKPGGVAFADYVLYPRSSRKTLKRIQVISPHNNKQTGKERWMVEHEDGQTAAYIVTMLPDGRGGTSFAVRPETPKAP